MECVVVNAFVTNVIITRHKRINEKFDAAQVVAGNQFSPTGDHVFGDHIQRNIDGIASRLIASAVGVKVQMTNRLYHAISCMYHTFI